ncbi:hypothetical protein BDN71DRAFT_1511977 [Pleurotus eryngii]|uniref:Uncharacterized protein n=1 Tax=Pleurotus eryngii TaxID=5323 RepID=A0A9P5ZJS4_PLEER|nr:hypothetical protein BDN71DRAFT_1511977 [Pleurotus eryngii]
MPPLIADFAAAVLSVSMLAIRVSDVNKIDQLNSHLADKEEELNRMQAQLDGVRRTLIESEEENDILRRTNLDKEATIQDLTTAQQVVSAETENVPREAAARHMEREKELVRELRTLQGTVADLEKKCKDNAKEIAHLNDVAHAQEKELKGYDEEILKVRDAQDKAKKELTNLNMKLSRAEDEVQLAQSQVHPQINYDWHIVDNTVAGKIIGKGLGGIEDQVLATQHSEIKELTDDNGHLDAELHSECVVDDAVNVGQAAKELPWETMDSSGAITSQLQVDPNIFEDHAPGEGDGRLSEGGSRLKRPQAGMTTRSSLPIATRSRPQLAMPPAAPAALLLELAIPAVPALELAAPPPSDHDIDNLFTVDMLKEAINAMGAKPLVGKSIQKAHLQQQAKDEAQKKRNLQE